MDKKSWLFDVSFYTLMGTLPLTFYLTRKVGFDSVNSNKYFARSHILNIGTIIFYGYNLITYDSMKSRMS